jgi:hypothetical protein
MYSDEIFWDSPTTSERRANEKMGRLLDECKEVQGYEHWGVQCLTWMNTVESDGGQLLPKVAESN